LADAADATHGWGEPSTSYGGDGIPLDLARTLSDLARSLQNEDSVQHTLDAVVAAAVGTVPGAEHAGIMVVEGRTVETHAITDNLVRNVDRAQVDTGQGPCLDAVWEHVTVRLPDTAREDRRPIFSHRAKDLGIRSMLSFQLWVLRDNLGALNLFSSQVDAFGDESENVGLLFASHAAVAMAGARKQQQLVAALSTRDLIGQAKGILMERHRLTADQAFNVLVHASQRTNLKLAEIARTLTETGTLQSATD
jgi:transcriptional regulator with GAF, ATPase, and Fis domain